jgi:dihydrodipicolinate synthase/N-acetylneuraminate lyase
MHPLGAADIRGNWATLLVPVNPDESLNFSQLETEIDRIISMNVDGIYSNGTAGEFYNQTEDEFDRISGLLAEKCNKAGVSFQIGCSHMSPVISLDRVRRAVPLGPGAVQVILPDWFPPTIAESIDFLRRVGEAAPPLGLVLYNPPHAKVQLAPEDYATIQEAGVPLVGCKTAGGDENWYRRMKAVVPGLSVFVPGHTLASGYRLGAHGAYSNVACIHPGAAQRWYHQIVTDPDAALELEKRIRAFMDTYIVPFITRERYSNQAVDKLMAAVGGWCDISPRLRWPYRWVPSSQVAPLRKAARELIPEFFP